MDDFYLVHEDKEYLQYCYKKIKEYIETKLHLRLNPKSGITRLDVNMNWLGFNFRLTENGRVTQKVTKKSIASWKAHILIMLQIAVR